MCLCKRQSPGIPVESSKSSDPGRAKSHHLFPLLAQIKIENFKGNVHHKFAVIDVEGSDPVVILGSYKWSKKGGYENDENTLIVHDRDLARSYYAEWQRLWSELGTETMCDRFLTYLPLTLKTSGQ